MTTRPFDPEELRGFLDALVHEIDVRDRIDSDPVGLVRPFARPEDREVAALLASTLAYGRVSLVRRAIRETLDRLDDLPFDALQRLTPRTFDGFVYRMTRGDDLYDLLVGVRGAIEEFGSLESCYAAGAGDQHLDRASSFVQTIRARRARPDVSRGLQYLLPDPADGSATKRLHMFFRWVARDDDGVDLGLWNSLPASELVMPLDTHTSRICRYLGLTDRKAADGIAARQVTESLRSLRPEDPLLYDFALAHLGISGRCIHRRSEEHCPGCPIEGACRLE